MSVIGAWSVYLIRTRAGALYAGVSNDVERRLQLHRSGRGSRYLRGRGPLELVYCRRIGERSLASKVEHALKRCSKADKEGIVADRPSRRLLLRLLDVNRVSVPGE